MSKVIVDTLENTTGTFTSAIDSLGPSTAFGGVGTHAFLYFYGSSLTEGDTKAGSDLYPAGFNYPTGGYVIHNNNTRSLVTTRGDTALSGTWRAMGRVYPSSIQYEQATRVTLYVRIA